MYVGVSKVTSRGQVTLPQQLREERGIKEGSEVAFFKTRGGIMLVTDSELDSMFERFSKKGAQLGLSREGLAREAKEFRARVK